MTSMNHPRRAYLQQAVRQWTRADMLVELYDAAIAQVRQSLVADKDHLATDALLARLKATRTVLGIAAGVRDVTDETSRNILLLCEFVQHSLLDGSTPLVEQALNILVTLRSGFEEIRAEANRLELAGEIPPVVEDVHFEMRV